MPPLTHPLTIPAGLWPVLAGGKPFLPPPTTLPEDDFTYCTWFNPNNHVYILACVEAYFAAHPEAGTDHRLEVLEVGSWCGASALTWLEGLAAAGERDFHLTCVDSWEPTIFGTLSPRDLFDWNVGTSPHAGRVAAIARPAREAYRFFADEVFDIVFIDADHRYEAVDADIHAARRTVRLGGVICGADLEAQIWSVDGRHLRENLHADNTVDPRSGLFYHPGVSVAVARHFGQLPVAHAFWAVQRTADGFVPLDLTGRTFDVRLAHFPEEGRALVRGFLPTGYPTARMVE